MRTSLFRARPTRALVGAGRAAVLGNQRAPRRAFASPPIKATSPPSPIEPSQEQAHPIGPFYESILRTPQPIPKKPEVPPVTSKRSDAAAPARAPAPAPAPAPTLKSTPASAPAPEEPAAAPARRGRKPKEAKDDSTSTNKAKSVAPDSASPSSSSTSTAPSLPSLYTSSFSPSSSSSLPPSAPPLAARPEEQTLLDQKNQEQERGSNDTDVQARARVVFGSSLAGPAERAERLAAIRSRSRLVAGVLVPPRPEEPDNCCMSGCVNCVWDRYRDEMEEWAAAHAEAERRLRAQEAGGAAVGAAAASMAAAHGLGQQQQLGGGGSAMSMDDDGGGSVANWGGGPSSLPSSASGGNAASATGDLIWDEDMYKHVPVGIREFMKQEKRLKEKHLREGTVGG
ncbi:oxidoreductase-like protein [Lasiosphaeria miniovina]|uniref:Oxidoreductase-like protein n=1 Tax=Lasiosphaeria miniovina TaxID=1954250 RepID=A0AA40A4U4_9PEZI|nr:oxidoreductase-like protein [Lasiosphaeria miniovina]KAK0709307.1 oxidoreductase-like protein [Lasiosphaeria miniovina]